MEIYTPVVPLMTIISKQLQVRLYMEAGSMWYMQPSRGEKEKKLGRIGLVKHIHKESF